MVSVLYIAPDASAHLEPVRDLLPDTGGASLLHSDVLVLRALASDSHALRGALMPILTRLSGDDLPRPWMI
jgi:urease accessory protein